jgi:phosphoesterase RecJ-like protein
VLPIRTVQGTFLNELRRHDRVLLTGHENPDGDCLGAEVALYHLLTELGAKPEIRNPDPVHGSLEFLGRSTPIGFHRPGDPLETDLVVLLDCCHVDRLGRLAQAVRSANVPIAVIDHHVGSDEADGAFSFVDPTSPATGELVHRLYKAAGVPLGAAAAEGIFVSLVSDTGWFRYSNTSSRVLAIAAELVECGVDASALYDRIHRQNAPESVAFLADALGRQRAELEGKYLHVSLDAETLERSRRIGFELDSVMEPLRSVRGVEVVALFKELADGRVKVSLRAVGDVDVQVVAAALGGGGHKKAAGATSSLPLVAVRDKVLALVESGIASVAART